MDFAMARAEENNDAQEQLLAAYILRQVASNCSEGHSPIPEARMSQQLENYLMFST